LEFISVKGGPNYRLYEGLGDSGSGLTAPINPNNDKPYGISHYSFVLDKIIPQPDPEGEIDITKIVVDHEDEVISEDNTEFKFRLYMWVDDDWEEVEDESPFYITGNDTVTIDGLPLGKYKVVEEDIPDGFELDSANDLEV